jgi:allantoinase
MSVPYPIEINDTPTMLSRAQPATDFHLMILDQFAEMVRLSKNQSLVFGISLHTFCTGQPFRLHQVRKALEALRNHPGFETVWVTTPGKIAEYAAKLPAACVP